MTPGYSAYRHYAWEEVAAFIDRPESLPLIRPWIPADAFVVLYGAYKSGKSFIAQGMAFGIVALGDWLGHVTPRSHVVLLCGEGVAGVRKRLKGLLKHHGLTLEDMGDRLHLLPMPVAMDDPGVIDRLIEDIEAQIPKGESLALIIVDTLSRYSTGNQDSAQDTGTFVNGVDRLRHAFPGCTALVVHHEGKSADRGPRGSTALMAAADVLLRTERPDMTSPNFTLSAEFMKDWETPEPLSLRMETIEIGLDADGEPITSAVVVQDEQQPSGKKRAHLTLGEEKALNALRNVIANQGEPSPRATGFPESINTVARKAAWAAEYIAMSAEDDPESAKRILRRHRTTLEKKARIGFRNEYVWLIP